MRSLLRRLLGAGLAGLALAWVPSTGVGREALEALIGAAPAAGLLRDSQKWIALLAPALCAGWAMAIEAAVRLAIRRGLPGGFAAPLALAPLVLLPSLAWGAAGALRPVQVPGEWESAAQVVAELPSDQRRVVVLPFSAYQRLPWNDGRAAVDPAIRFFPAQMVTSDILTLGGGRSVAGDDGDAAAIAAAVAAGADLGPALAAVGVRYVLVEKTAAGAQRAPVPGGRVLFEGAELRLIDLGGEGAIRRGSHPGLVIAADGVALLVLAGSCAYLAVRRFLYKPDVPV